MTKVSKNIIKLFLINKFNKLSNMKGTDSHNIDSAAFFFFLILAKHHLITIIGDKLLLLRFTNK